LLEELLGLARLRGRLEQFPGSAAEIVDVDAALLGLFGHPLSEVQRLVEQRRAAGGLLAHLVENRPLGTRGDDRLVDPLDPDERPPAVAAAVVADRLDRVDLVGPGVLAEAEEDHPVAVRHGRSITAAAADAWPLRSSSGQSPDILQIGVASERLETGEQLAHWLEPDPAR